MGVVDDIESDISSKEATIVLNSLLEFLDEFTTVVINDSMKLIFEPLILFLQRISERGEKEEKKNIESGPEENEPLQSGRVINTNTNGNNNNNNNGRRLGIGSSSSSRRRRRKLEGVYYDDDGSNGSAKKCSEKTNTNTNDNFMDMFMTESISSMLNFNTLQQTIVDSVGD